MGAATFGMAENGQPSCRDGAVRPGAPDIAGIREGVGRRSIVLVGMMGAGKSSVGRRLAQALELPFVDADNEIEAAAGGMTIPEIFATHGEDYFRWQEARVLARLLEDGPKVLATGGGAWLNPETRARIAASGVSIWLKAEIDVLLKRVRKRSNRPLLASPDPEAALRALVEARYPIYATADLTVISRDAPHEHVIAEVLEALRVRFAEPSAPRLSTPHDRDGHA